MITVQIVILVEDGFVPTELALVQDVFRIANRLEGGAFFSTVIGTSSGSELVEGDGGMMLRARTWAGDWPNIPNHLIVLGGCGVRRTFPRMQARFNWLDRLGCRVVLLSDAASEWKKLFPEAAGITTHWENHQLLRDADLATDRDLPLYSQRNRITTAAGMMATADAVLGAIVASYSSFLAQATARVLLMDRIRGGETSQPRSEHDTISLRHAKIERVIAAMEENLAVPVPISELAGIAGYSTRQLERRFNRVFGQAPAAFYRSLRLRRGKVLLEQTDLSITEIAVICGFSGSSTFAKIFARDYGVTPKRWRDQLAVNAICNSVIPKPEGRKNAPLALSACSSRASANPFGTNGALVKRAGH